MIRIIFCVIIGYLIGGWQWYNIGYKNGYVDGKCEDNKFKVPKEEISKKIKEFKKTIIKPNNPF